MEKILNIAAGRFLPLDVPPRYFLVNVDTMFYLNNPPEQVERAAIRWDSTPLDKTEIYNVNEDVFKFMERTVIPFDRVCIYRFLEHVSFTQVEYFIYLVSTVLRQGGIVDVIVPNYEVLAKMIIEEDAYFEENNMAVFPEHNILLTTELLNEPSSPHASIWTPDRAHYFWELEKRFMIRQSDTQETFEFDGRDIYLRFKAERV